MWGELGWVALVGVVMLCAEAKASGRRRAG